MEEIIVTRSQTSASDTRAAEPPSRPKRILSFLRRFSVLQLGLILMGLGIALMLDANLGVNPWAVLHQGLSRQLPISFGVATQLVGLAVLGLSMLAFKIRPGIGTVFNALLVGPWVDLFRVLPGFPNQSAFIPGLVQCLISIVLIGFSTGIYIGAHLGAGPRDGFVLGVAEIVGMSVRRTRFVIELVVLTVGFLLGGLVGWGTLLFALLSGPIMQFSLELFKFQPEVRSAVEQDA